MQKHNKKTKYTSRFLSSIVIITVLAHASLASYPLPEATGPSSSYTFPDAFADFDISHIASTVSVPTDVPQIAEWTRQNQPGDTMAIAGYRLGSDFIFHANGKTVSSAPLFLEGDQASVTLPLSLASQQFTLIWNGNEQGYGQPARINGTEAWWLGPEKAARGESFSIYGQNLDLSQTCYAYIEGYGWIESDSANPYKADFTVPGALGNGTYTVWAHNGQGLEYGWGKPLKLEIYDGMQWNEDAGSWHNVVRDYGAAGDGVSDDSAEIMAALAAADEEDWSTVYIPAGIYRINSKISDSISKVRIMGASSESTILVEKDGGLGADLLDLNADDCEICDMTVQTDDDSISNNNLLDLVGSENIVLRNLLVSQLPNAGNGPGYADPLRMTEENLVRIIDCTFYTGSTILLKNSDQVFIEGCDFRALNDANSIISLGASRDISIIDSTCGHYDFDAGLEYTGAGRFILCNPGKGAPNNWYYGGNETIEFTTHTDNNNHNAAEDFLFENTDVEWYDSPVSVDGALITFSNLPSSVEGNFMYWIDYTAMIVEGKGLGQARTVVGYDYGTDTLTFDEPFRVQPDSNSVIQFGFAARNIVVYDNVFDGNWDRVNHSDDPADAGVETYGAAHKVIVDSNLFTDKETAFYVYSGAKPTVYTGENTPRPNYFGVYQNNVCTNTQTATRYITTEDNANIGDPMSPGIGHVGHVFRKNHFFNTTEHVWHYEWREHNAGLYLTVFDQNTASNYADDVHYEAVHSSDDGNTRPSSIQNQVLVDEYIVANAPLPPPPDEPPPAPVLSSIEISGPVFIDEQTTAQFICTATYSDGSTATVVPVWTEDSSDATISNSGLLSTDNVTADGTVTISAEFEGKTDSITATIRFVAPFVESLQISGPDNLDEGSSAQYTCLATYSDGSVLSVNPSWSENRSLATISSTGVLNVGDVSQNEGVTITAAFAGVTTTYRVTVNYVPPTVDGLIIIGAASLDEGTSETYSCVASYSDGTTAVVSPSWSDNSSDASISSSGVLSAGNVDSDMAILITAEFAGLSSSKALTINYLPPVLASLKISGPTTVDEESSASYTCEATYSDGSRTAVSPNWNVASGFASIDNAGELTTGNVGADESISIVASYGGVSGSLGVTIQYIPPVVTSLSISGPGLVDEGSLASYTCTAGYSDGTSGTVNPVWTLVSSYASISSSGLLSTGDVESDQTVSLLAELDGISTSYTITIAYVAPPVVITGLSIEAPSVLSENTNAVLGCTAIYSDGSTETVVPTWSVDASFASVDGGSVLSVGNVESDDVVTVTASYEGITQTQSIGVWAVSTQIVYPLTGFSGKTVNANLWDQTNETWIELGEMNAPDELVIENVIAGGWYFILIQEYSAETESWEVAHSNWINM